MRLLLKPSRRGECVRTERAVDGQVAADPGTEPLVCGDFGLRQPQVQRPLPRSDQRACTSDAKEGLRRARCCPANKADSNDTDDDHPPHLSVKPPLSYLPSAERARGQARQARTRNATTRMDTTLCGQQSCPQTLDDRFGSGRALGQIAHSLSAGGIGTAFLIACLDVSAAR